MTEIATDQSIREHATFMRGVLVRMLESATGSADTLNACAYATVLLSVSLDRFFDVVVTFQGGDGRGDGGFVDTQGMAHGHYWLKVQSRSNDKTWLVDVTADQFGGQRVLVEPWSATNGRHVPGDQRIVDDHLRGLLARIEQDASHLP